MFLTINELYIRHAICAGQQSALLCWKFCFSSIETDDKGILDVCMIIFIPQGNRTEGAIVPGV